MINKKDDLKYSQPYGNPPSKVCVPSAEVPSFHYPCQQFLRPETFQFVKVGSTSDRIFHQIRPGLDTKLLIKRMFAKVPRAMISSFPRRAPYELILAETT
jgi:hypothetical protein